MEREWGREMRNHGYNMTHTSNNISTVHTKHMSRKIHTSTLYNEGFGNN